MDITSIHQHPGVCRGCWGDQGEDKAESVPTFQLGAPRGNFGSLVPSCQGHKQQLLGLFCSPCKVIPLVCVCPWRSVCLSWSCGGGGHFHECSGFIHIFMGCSGDASQHRVKEPGIHVPVDEGNLHTTLIFRELPPCILGGDLAPAAHPCSVSLPFLWQS